MRTLKPSKHSLYHAVEIDSRVIAAPIHPVIRMPKAHCWCQEQ